MNVKIEKKEKNVIVLEIEVDKETFEVGMQKAYKKNVKNISIAGFRKGHAPRKVIETAYGEGVFYDDAINFICPDAYDKAVEENAVSPVDRPEIDIIQIGEGKNLIFSAKITVKPEVIVSEYKEIKVDKIEYEVSDEDVTAEIDRMRDQNSRLVVVENRAIQTGDVAVIDYEGFVDDVPFEGGKGENHPLEIGAGQFIPGFEEQLIGKNTGDETDVNVTFPTEYHSEELKGKSAVFKVKIHTVKAKELPAADDEFAKDVSDFDTIDQLSKDIKDKLIQNAETRTKREIEDKVLEEVAKKTEIEIPDCMVEAQIDRMLEDYRNRLSSQGLTLEQYAEYTGMSMDKMRDQFRESAKSGVKGNLILEKIAELENIEVTEEEVNNQFQKLADQYKMEVDKIKSIMGDSIESVENEIKINKTLDFLVENAVIKKARKKGEKKNELGADGSGADK